jgi:hypothetical protein
MNATDVEVPDERGREENYRDGDCQCYYELPFHFFVPPFLYSLLSLLPPLAYHAARPGNFRRDTYFEISKILKTPLGSAFLT